MPSFGNQRGRGGGFRGRGRGGVGSRGGRGGAGGGGPKLPAALRDQMTETYGPSDGRKDRRKHYVHAPKPPGGRQQVDQNQENSDPAPRAGPSRPQIAPKINKSRAKVEKPIAAPPPKKKKKELRLPGVTTDDAEDGEIKWLEYALRNEKGKGKEEDSDGLDGELDTLNALTKNLLTL